MVLNLGLPNGFGGSNKITYCGSQEVALSDVNHLMALNTGDKNSKTLYTIGDILFLYTLTGPVTSVIWGGCMPLSI